MRDFRAALLDPHYVACIAAMPDASDMLGNPHAVYVGPAGVHWELTIPPASLLDSPAAQLPWQVYEHSDVDWAGDAPSGRAVAGIMAGFVVPCCSYGCGRPVAGRGDHCGIVGCVPTA